MMSAILSFNTTALLQGDVVPPTIYIATSSLPKNAMIEWQVMLGLQSSSSTDDSDDDERSPISLTQRLQLVSILNFTFSLEGFCRLI
jgi:hypothetical protein